MNLHAVTPIQIWAVGYENDEGSWNEWHIRATQAEAARIEEYLERVEVASGGAISESTVYRLLPERLQTGPELLADLQDFLDDWLENE